MRYNPMNAVDAYKLDHRRQYPDGTSRVYSNWTARGSRLDSYTSVVFFGLQAFLQQYCIDQFNEWFTTDEDEACAEYQVMLDRVLGPNDIGTDHVRALHRLGYLPLEFRALPEGTDVPLRVPMFTVENTLPEFFWLTNYIESVMSSHIWLPCTSATTANRLRKMLNKQAKQTGQPIEAVAWQGHDFSFRGMENVEASAASGAGHLLSFTGTDSLPALEYVDSFYPGDNGLVGGSVPATEHSVMCAGGELNEADTFSRLLDLYPQGILSVVSDTWDLWYVITRILPGLKDKIMARPGKLVIRPDSGDPANIICGTKDRDSHLWDVSETEARRLDRRTPEEKGVVELLWEIFGGTEQPPPEGGHLFNTTNGRSQGFKVLDEHIGAIYGDSINYDRASEITHRLRVKGFASTNVVFGVGSYTYQLQTRDTFGFAMKATWAEVNGEGHDLFKDPITDDGVKKSAKGRLSVVEDNRQLVLINQATPKQESESLLAPVWRDGKFLKRYSFAEVRKNLHG